MRTQLGGQLSYSQRGPNVDLWLSQHSFHPPDGLRKQRPRTMRVASESPLRYKVVLRAYRETVEDAKGPHPSNGYFVGTAPEVTWDRYHWHNLAPSGYCVSAEFCPGYFLGANQHRHQARLPDLQGIPLASTTVLMINGGVALPRGDLRRRSLHL